MKGQSYFVGKKKENSISLSSADLAQRVVCTFQLLDLPRIYKRYRLVIKLAPKKAVFI